MQMNELKTTFNLINDKNCKPKPNQGVVSHIMSVNTENKMILNLGMDLRLGHLGTLLVKFKKVESFWKAIW